MGTSVQALSPRRGESLLARAELLRKEAAQLEREAALVVEPTGSLSLWTEAINCPVVSDLAEPHGNDLVAGARDDARRAIHLARAGRPQAALFLAAKAEARGIAEPEARVGFAIARVLVQLAEGHPERAFSMLADAFARSRTESHPDLLLPTVGLFAEAAFRTRRTDTARDVIRGLVEKAGFDFDDSSNGEVFLAGRLVGADATRDLSSGDNAVGSVPELVGARLQLAIGMWLRRHRRTIEARAYLHAAGTTFLRPGGTPWLALCRSESDAAKLTQRKASPSDVLSTQQLVVARLAAQGLSNRDIARRLCVSPRTVSSHLYRIFPALGVSSRNQLAGVIAISP